MLEINLLDVAVAIILLAFLVCGLVRGLTREVGGLVGIIGGFALARHFQSTVQPPLETFFSNPDVAGIAAFLLIFILTMIVVALLAFGLRKFMSISLGPWVDHLLGAFAGLAKGVLIMSLVFFLAQGFFPDLQLVQTAQATPFFDSLIDYLRTFLPDVFNFRLPIRL